MAETYFRYRAIAADGRIVKGEMAALNEAALAGALASQGFELITARARRRAAVTGRARLTRRELIDFFYYLEMLLKAGVPALDALRDLADSTESPLVRIVAANMAEGIGNGMSVAEAFAAQPAAARGALPSLIKSGEMSGTLEHVLAEIVAALKWQDEIAAATKKALLYPAFATTVIAGVVVFLMNYVVPQLITFIKSMGGELPFHTRALIWVSGVFRDFWWLVLGAPPALVMLLAALARTSRPLRKRLHAHALRLPVFGPILKRLTLAQAVNTLAMMYRSGIPLLDALEQTAQATSNLVIADALLAMQAEVAAGALMSVACANTGVFPPLVVRMLRVGENTGALDEALMNAKYFYQRDIEEAVERLQAMIEPALTVVLGLILGWIMLAVLGPIYDTISKIKA